MPFPSSQYPTYGMEVLGESNDFGEIDMKMLKISSTWFLRALWYTNHRRYLFNHRRYLFNHRRYCWNVIDYSWMPFRRVETSFFSTGRVRASYLRKGRVRASSGEFCALWMWMLWDNPVHLWMVIMLYVNDDEDMITQHNATPFFSTTPTYTT